MNCKFCGREMRLVTLANPWQKYPGMMCPVCGKDSWEPLEESE